MTHSILIAEDSLHVADFIERRLRSNGYQSTVVDNGKDALSMGLTEQFSLLILDLGLPQKDGISVLNELRGQGIVTPIIVLTSRTNIEDRVASFDNGANDYLPKPFHFEELLMRIRARLNDVLIHQQAPAKPETVIICGELELDLLARKVQIKGRTVHLSNREFLLAETFARSPGQIMSRQQLLTQVWGCEYCTDTNIVDVYIGYLRKKLGKHLFETVRGKGYRLNP